MYEFHWKLSKRPFEDGAHPEFYFASQTHQTALLKLRYLIDQQKGIGIIAGEHGLGKSYLTHVLEQEFVQSRGEPFIRLLFPQLSPAGTLAYFAGRLGSTVTSHDSDDVVLRGLEQQLDLYRQQERRLVLLIDDAHLLEVPQLHLLRLLLNLREEGRSDFSLILSGRTELLSRLQRLTALDQRVIVRTALEPLTQSEFSRTSSTGSLSQAVGNTSLMPLPLAPSGSFRRAFRGVSTSSATWPCWSVM